MTTSIAKNTAFMTLASVAQKIISFVYFTFIARSIGVEGTGKYFLALSFTTIFVVFVDLGLTNVLIREASRVKENIQKYVSTILAVKLFFGVVSYFLVFVVSSLLYEDTELKHMIWLSGVTMLFDSFNLTVYGVLRAIGDLRFESLSITMSQFVSLILGSIFLVFHLPLIFLILAFTIPSALNALYSTYTVYHRYSVKPIPSFDKKIFLFLWKITLPFALAAIFARVYGYIDSLLLKQMMGSQAVGFYSTPYKITFASQFIPMALTAALYPRFSEYFVTQKEKLATIFQDAMKYLLIVAVPIAFGISILAKDIILFLYKDEFLPSVLPLQILILSLIFSFLSFPIGAMLNACNKQTTQTKVVGFVMLLNIILNLVLIPVIGVAGAALAACIGNVALTVIGYLFISQIAPVSHVRMAEIFFQVVGAGMVMGFIVWSSNMYVHFLVSILLGVVVYGIMLLVTRSLTFPEIKEFGKVFRK